MEGVKPPMPLAMQWVLAQYGATMLAVQGFELLLAGLVQVAEFDPARLDRPGPPLPGKRLERTVRKSLKNTWHLVQVASASEMRRRLEGKVADELMTEITVLTKWRDFLAHRYLRTRLVGSSESAPVVDPGLAIELFELGKAFGECSERIREETASIMAAWSRKTDKTPEQVRKAMAEAVSSTLHAQPERFSRARHDAGQRIEADSY
jgi:hypothetical protein